MNTNMPPISPGPAESLLDKGAYLLKMAEIGTKAGKLKDTLDWQPNRNSAANTIAFIGQTNPKLAAHLEAEYLGEIDRLRPGTKIH